MLAALLLQAALTPTPMLTGPERSAAIARIGALMRERFYDPARVAGCLRPIQVTGRYDGAADPERFAAMLTTDLAGCGDRHLRVAYEPEARAPVALASPSAAAAPQRDELAEQYRRRNYDFRQLSRLEGNVGYLRLYTFAPARLGGDMAAAAMRFLSTSDAVIIDLRGNRGGYPDLGLLIASYFFARPTHYADVYRRVGDRTEQQWTLPYLPGPRLPEQPLYILVGRDSFSGAESLAYNLQQLHRAVIVGEPTGGGATGGNTVRVDARFTIFISDVNFTSPVSGANWEGGGVVPDIPAAYVDALTVAHRAALTRLAERASDPAQRQEYLWAAEMIAARAAPPPAAADLAGLAGRYGGRTIMLEDGRLLYRNGENSLFQMLRVGADSWMLDGEPSVRFSFERGGDGRAIRLRAAYSDGSTLEMARAGDAR